MSQTWCLTTCWSSDGILCEMPFRHAVSSAPVRRARSHCNHLMVLPSGHVRGPGSQGRRWSSFRGCGRMAWSQTWSPTAQPSVHVRRPRSQRRRGSSFRRSGRKAWSQTWSPTAQPSAHVRRPTRNCKLIERIPKESR